MDQTGQTGYPPDPIERSTLFFFSRHSRKSPLAWSLTLQNKISNNVDPIFINPSLLTGGCFSHEAQGIITSPSPANKIQQKQPLRRSGVPTRHLRSRIPSTRIPAAQTSPPSQSSKPSMDRQERAPGLREARLAGARRNFKLRNKKPKNPFPSREPAAVGVFAPFEAGHSNLHPNFTAGV